MPPSKLPEPVAQTPATRSRSLGTALARSAILRELARTGSSPDVLWISRALQELQLAHQELATAEEELHQQADDLVVTQRTLEVERRCYRELFEGAPDPHIVTDTQGVVLDVNHRACDFLQAEPALLLGRRIARFVAQEDRKLLRTMLRAVCQAPDATRFELNMLPRTATTPVAMHASVAPTLRTNPLSAGLLWIVRQRPTPRDTHAQPRADDPAVSLLQERLVEQGRVRAELERELDLLRAFRLRAERDTIRREHELAGVAQMLRRTLTEARSSVSALHRESDDSDMCTHLAGVLSEHIHGLAHGLDRLLRQDKLESRPVLVRTHTVDLLVLLERVCEDARKLLQGGTVKVALRCCGYLREVNCDELRMGQALMTLVVHAAQDLASSARAGLVEIIATECTDAFEVEIRLQPTAAVSAARSTYDPLKVPRKPAFDSALESARRLVRVQGGQLELRANESSTETASYTYWLRCPRANSNTER
ncbi:MAG: hypothetical protein RL701_7857 [Pseudomonadota bacterium]